VKKNLVRNKNFDYISINLQNHVFLQKMDPLNYFYLTNQTRDGVAIGTQFNTVFWSLITLNIIAITYVKTVYPSYIPVLFRTGIYNRQLYQNLQEDLRLNNAGSVLLTLTYIIALTLLLTLFLPYTTNNIAFKLLSGLGVVFLIKFIAIRFLRFINKQYDGLTEHWQNHLIFFQILGLLFTPVLAFTYFAPQSVQKYILIGLIIILIGLILIREIHSLMRALRLKISIVYIILYLCTLEIIPLVVFIRALVN